MPQNKWTWEETLLAFHLYCRLPFGKMDHRTQEVKDLAALIGRTANSVAMKLGNIASLDPTLRERGVKGLQRRAKQEEEIWERFENDWGELFEEAQRVMEGYHAQSEDAKSKLDDEPPSHYGKTESRRVNARLGQDFFRDAVLAAYEGHCCITGIAEPQLLIASHIVPWKDNEAQRMNPQNGLCLNSLHDKAFESGLLWITPDRHVKLSKELKERREPVYEEFFHCYEGKQIRMPEKFPPNPELLKKRGNLKM